MPHACISLYLLRTVNFVDSAELNRYCLPLLDGRNVRRMRRVCGNSNDYLYCMCGTNSGRINRALHNHGSLVCGCGMLLVGEVITGRENCKDCGHTSLRKDKTHLNEHC